jgi:hypothetical protein
MKAKVDEISQRYLLLFKLDAKALFERVYNRRHEYISIFALKRNRDHFQEVFKTRYWSATVSDLSHCSSETIEALNQYYKLIDELKWYLDHTEDMPNTIEDYLDRYLKKLKQSYDLVNLYIDAQLGIDSKPEEHFNFDFTTNEETISEVGSVLSDDDFSTFEAENVDAEINNESEAVDDETI